MFHNLKIIPLTDTALTGRLAVELAHLLGFESASMVFPILAEAPSDAQGLYFALEERPGPYTLGKRANVITLGFEAQADLPRLWHACSTQFFEMAEMPEPAHAMTPGPAYTPASAAAQSAIPSLDPRPQRGLESLFVRYYILISFYRELLPNYVDV